MISHSIRTYQINGDDNQSIYTTSQVQTHRSSWKENQFIIAIKKQNIGNKTIPNPIQLKIIIVYKLF